MGRPVAGCFAKRTPLFDYSYEWPVYWLRFSFKIHFSVVDEANNLRLLELLEEEAICRIGVSDAHTVLVVGLNTKSFPDT